MSSAMDKFFCLPEAEQQRLRDLQDDPDSPFYRKVMSEIIRATEAAAGAENSHPRHGT